MPNPCRQRSFWARIKPFNLYRDNCLSTVKIEIDRDFSLVALTDGHRLRTFDIHHQSSLDFLEFTKIRRIFMNRLNSYVVKLFHLPFASPICQRSSIPLSAKPLPKTNMIVEDSFKSINGGNSTPFPKPVNRGCQGTRSIVLVVDCFGDFLEGGLAERGGKGDTGRRNSLEL